jgi:hypothetical protein
VRALLRMDLGTLTAHASRFQVSAGAKCATYAAQMGRALEIRDTRNRVFLHMSEVLGAVEPEARGMHWTILDLGEAFAPDGSDYDVLAVDRQVRASQAGLQLTFDELVDFAGRLQQVIDGLFIGCRDAVKFPRRDDPDSVIVDRSDMVLAALDSTLWVVAASDETLDRIAKRFERVSERDVHDVTLSTWGR